MHPFLLYYGRIAPYGGVVIKSICYLFTFYYCLFPTEHHSSSSSSFLLSVSSRLIYFVTFFQNMSRRTPPSCLLFNSLHSYRFQIRNITYRSGLCLSSNYISCPRSKRKTYLPAHHAVLLQMIKPSCRCTHEKNSKRTLGKKQFI